MKKANHILLTALAIMISIAASAQLYVTIGPGYGFAANKELIAWSYKADANSETFTGEYGTFGKGMDVSVNFGYMLNDWCGLELGYSFIHPFNNQILAASYEDRSDTSLSITGTDEFGLQMHRIYIGDRFTMGEGNFKPYIRTGILLGMGGKFSHGDYRSYQSTGNTTQTDIFTEYTGGIAFGYAAAIGATYSFSDMVGIYFEAGFVGQKWAPEKSVITRYDIDGVDQLPNMDVRDKETIYVEELTFDNNPPNDNEPDEDLKQYLPLSTIGVNIGVRLSFGGE